MFDGQSLIYAPVTSPSWPDRYMAPRHHLAESFRVAVQGTTFADRSAGTINATTRVDPLLTPTDRRVVLVSDAGTSDILAGLTVVQILTAMDAYHDARRTAGADHIAIPTVVPASTMTGPQDIVRQDLNEALLLDPTAAGADQVIDIAALPSLQDPADLTAFYDGQHYTAAAAQLVANTWLGALT